MEASAAKEQPLEVWTQVRKLMGIDFGCTRRMLVRSEEAPYGKPTWGARGKRQNGGQKERCSL